MKVASFSDFGRIRNPYANRPDKSIWRKSASSERLQTPGSVYTPKFSIEGLKIATAGSCFAQHIGAALKQQGYPFLDKEPAPPALAERHHADFGFGMYSARYGNIYSPRQMLQLVRAARGRFTPREAIWTKGKGFVDAFRPTLEKIPFASREEVLACRAAHLRAVRRLFKEADVFIFTLGLTEIWESVQDGAVYPVAPGVNGGVYDPEKHRFRNLSVFEVMADLEALLVELRALNPDIRMILTVSPVPLAATASQEHVVVATAHSKAILRTAAAEMTARHSNVDYFPSYDLVTGPAYAGQAFEADGRTVRREVVANVMSHFFHAQANPLAQMPALDPHAPDWADPKCDESLLGSIAHA